MQNISRAQHVNLPRITSLVVAAVATIVIAFALAPSSAFAKSYTMPKVDMDINLTAAGDVDVVEHRTFDFDGSFTCVWWTFGQIPSNAEIEINGVSFQEGSGESYAVQGVPFQTSWRSAGGPGTDAFSYDEAERTLYAFFDVYDEKLTVTIDYTVVNGISAYDDMGEFYWKLVTAGWAVDSQNVTAKVSLPVPQGEQVVGGQNVRAWGHGTLDGTVHFNEDGTISYAIPQVKSGEFAEARVLFPREWLTGLSTSSAELHKGQTILDEALADEQQWANDANFQRTMALAFVGFWVVLSLLLIGWAVVMFFRWGKELKPTFTDQYWRDVPDKDLPAAVIGRLMGFDKKDASQFTATLMGLSAKGVVRIDKGSYEGRHGKQVDDYYLTLMPEMLDIVEVDALERKAINIIFGTIAQGENQLWFKSIEAYGKKHPESFTKKMDSWQGELTAQVNKAQLFEAKSDSLQLTMRLIAIGYLLIGGLFWWVSENLLQMVAILPTCLILFLISRVMSRRTQRGTDTAAKATALKRWLKDFTRLDERPPTDVKVWGQFMVYAFLFGIADQVMKDMRMHVPTFRDMDDATFYTTMPYYYWYSPSFGGRHALAASIFDATVTNTINTATAAVSEMSSGGGGGGGFGGGGGGGFGGGGGGGAR